METPAEFCKKYHACADGAAFAAQFATLAEAWGACHRADWMVWAMRMADKTGGLDRPLRIFACDCAEAAKPTDPRSLAAIAVARRYADGMATVEELRAAYAAAARVTASDASDASAYAASPASASSAAASAAATAASAASAASADATRHAQAERLRALIANPFTTV